MEVMWEAEEKTPKDLSASSSRTSWSRELKLLRSLEATDSEDEESQSSRTYSTVSGGIGRRHHRGSLIPQPEASNSEDSDLEQKG